MTTWTEARAAARAALVPLWDASYGRLVVERRGFEDDQAWLVPYHPAGDYLLGAPWLLVDKTTGAVQLVPMHDGLDRVHRMEPTS